MKYSRLLSGESEPIVIAGIPAAMAALISGAIRFEFATETKIPAGFLATIALNSSTSAWGLKAAGPRVSTVTPYPTPAAANPAVADFQYGTSVFVAIK